MNSSLLLKLANQFYSLAEQEAATISNIRGNIKYNVDKSSMYSDYGATVDVTIPISSRQEAEELYNNYIKNNRKLNLISPWRLLHSEHGLESEIYTSIMLTDHPVHARSNIVNNDLRRINAELEKVGISLGAIIPPRSGDEDYPSKPELRLVR